MPYSMFYDLFPEIAKEETRSLIVFNDSDLPPDVYALMELFCDEPGCDCRRVMFHIFSDNRKEFLAVIAFGWESDAYYAKWLGEKDPELIRELKGPVLNVGSSQSRLAPVLLIKVKEVLGDKTYVERLKNHYRLFKEAIGDKNYKKTENIASEKVGRNDPCPCGSGKNFEHCCSK